MTSCWCKIIACSKWIKIIRINHWTFSTCISTQYGHVRLHVNVKMFVLPSCLHETLKKNYCFKESIGQFFINIIHSLLLLAPGSPPWNWDQVSAGVERAKLCVLGISVRERKVCRGSGGWVPEASAGLLQYWWACQVWRVLSSKNSAFISILFLQIRIRTFHFHYLIQTKTCWLQFDLFFKHGLLAFSKAQVLSLCCAFEKFLMFIDDMKNSLKLKRRCPYTG